MKVGIACEYSFKGEGHRAVIHTNDILVLLGKAMPAQAKPARGNGKVTSPFQPTLLGHWSWLAQRDVGESPDFILVGERLIARWGTGALKFANYCTDVTNWAREVGAKATGSNYEDYVAELGRRYKVLDEQANIPTELTSYTRKALRMGGVDDRLAAQTSREMMQGRGHCKECPELASSLCSLLICEARRAPVTFVISLMLLDLIETYTTYGEGGRKQYTWQSMLMHGVDGKYIPGRGRGIKGLGKHPMAGAGTVDMGKNIFQLNQADNIVRDRVLSVACVWLAHYMTRHEGLGGQYKFYIVRQSGHPKWAPRKAPTDFGPRTLKKNCGKAIARRLGALDLLIGGTTVYYQDMDGRRV